MDPKSVRMSVIRQEGANGCHVLIDKERGSQRVYLSKLFDKVGLIF